MADQLDKIILESLDKEDPNLLRAACLMAGGRGLAEAERGLLKALAAKAWQVQAEAARALGLAGSPGCLPFLRRLLKASDADLRQKMLAAVAQTKAEEVPGEAHPEVKRAAAVAINRLDPAACQDTLLGALNSDNPNLMVAAMAGLANLEAVQGRERMQELLSHADPAVRRAAAASLGRLRQAPAVPGLIALLDDPQAEVRKEAVIALNHIKDRQALEPLAFRLEDSDPEVRRVAAIALANSRSKSETVIRALGAALRDREPAVRQAALSALANLKAEHTLEEACLLLGDTHEAVARQAAVTVSVLLQARERPEYENDCQG